MLINNAIKRARQTTQNAFAVQYNEEQNINKKKEKSYADLHNYLKF